jgi:hypothetical protein
LLCMRENKLEEFIGHPFTSCKEFNLPYIFEVLSISI